MQPSDALHYKVLLNDSLEGQWMQGFFDIWAHRDPAARYALPDRQLGNHRVPWTGEMIADDMRMSLRMTESYYVSGDIMEVIQAASLTMPPEVLQEEDVPSTHGFLLFEKPWMMSDIHVKAMPIRGLLWSTRMVGKPETGPEKKGIVVWALVDLDDRMIDDYWKDGDNLDIVRNMLTHGVRFTPATVYSVVFNSYSLELANQKGHLIMGAGKDNHFDHLGDGVWRMTNGRYSEEVKPEPLTTFLQALWAFQRQRIAMSERPHLRKTTAKTLLRRQMLPNPVSVIKLRARMPGPETGAHYHLSHRFIVRGHWRRQWYPSEQRHRSIYINPFIKGPDNAPFLVRQRVTAVVR